MSLLSDVLDSKGAPEPADPLSALLAAEAALLDLESLNTPVQSTGAEASDQVGVTSYDPNATLQKIVRAMGAVLQFAAIMEAGDSNARLAAKTVRDLDRGVEVLRAVSREFERRADASEEFRLALKAFHAASRVLYNAKLLVTVDSGPVDSPRDDDDDVPGE
jgi:hypothetical protein